jgi:hypothetical protein
MFARFPDGCKRIKMRADVHPKSTLDVCRLLPIRCGEAVGEFIRSTRLSVEKDRVINLGSAPKRGEIANPTQTSWKAKYLNF